MQATLRSLSCLLFKTSQPNRFCLPPNDGDLSVPATRGHACTHSAMARRCRAWLLAASSVTLQLCSGQEVVIGAGADVQAVLAPLNPAPPCNCVCIGRNSAQLSAIMEVVVAASDEHSRSHGVAAGHWL